jgi:hypothetical protein
MLSMTIFALAAAAQSPILHYVRSNRDGSEPEHVVHYRPTRTGIAVYKWVEKCTTAAYVTAEMNETLRDGRRFVAGKVAKDGSQAAFGTLDLDAAGPALVLDVTPPGGERIQERHALGSRPYLLYDFDFADLNAFLQETRPGADFAFELPVLWPAEGPTLWRDYGLMRARFAGEETHNGRAARRFDLAVEGKPEAAGKLWVDAKDGFIVEAELGLPNHLEYKDFRLKLDKVDAGGKAAWDALTASQYADCPAGN